jgi:hypothetical protein
VHHWCLLSFFVDQITWGTKSWYGFSKCQVLMLNFCFVGLLRQGTQVRHSFPLKILFKNVARERIKDNPTFRDYLEVKVGRHGSPWSFFLCVFVVKLVWSVLRANCRRILSTSLLCKLNHWSWSGFNCVSCFLWGGKEVYKMGWLCYDCSLNFGMHPPL